MGFEHVFSKIYKPTCLNILKDTNYCKLLSGYYVQWRCNLKEFHAENSEILKILKARFRLTFYRATDLNTRLIRGGREQVACMTLNLYVYFNIKHQQVSWLKLTAKRW